MKEQQDNLVFTVSALASEEVRYKGYAIIEDVIPGDIITEASVRLDVLQKQQYEEIGKENIYDINEQNIVRLPFLYDSFFMWRFLNNPVLKNVVSELLGTYHQLHSQNGLLIGSEVTHGFSTWHRDLFLSGTGSVTNAVTVMYCLQDLSPFSGGPVILPFSHEMQRLPSAEYIKSNQLTITAKAGSMIVMNSRLYHRAGPNNSSEPRRSIKQIYTDPHIKQEIDIPAALKGEYSSDPFFSMLLGYNHSVPDSVKEFRLRKLRKIRK